MAKTRKPRAKQGYLPDMEPPVIHSVDHAAENYYETMMERVELSRDEDEKKTALIEKMKEHGLERYEFDDFVVTITAKTNVKVKRKSRVEDEQGDESEGDGE